jgi:hypothetical protein
MSDERGRNDIVPLPPFVTMDAARHTIVAGRGLRYRTIDYLDGYVLIARQTELLSKQL